MSKIKKEIAVFTVLLILVVLWALFIRTQVNTSTLVNTSTPVNSTPVNKSTSVNTTTPVNTSKLINNITSDSQSQVGGLFIQFEDGISEKDVGAILQNINMTTNYSMEYNTNTSDDIHYIMVDKDKMMYIRGAIEKDETWKVYAPTVIKGNYFIITVPEEIIQNKDFLEMLKKYNLQLKKFVWYDIRFYNGSKKWWIPEEKAMMIKNELEQNEKIFFVHLSYYYSS